MNILKSLVLSSVITLLVNFCYYNNMCNMFDMVIMGAILFVIDVNIDMYINRNSNKKGV